ncbi:D-lyxose/D-mannose family sugar isomerase [Clostridium sp. 'deep sea']|uniref:D-lyxose/D-mannose family sugar isomerase n=1 Tax=Clostridium sp. 'deep sea' TaxID=2779445 RepID=UPI0018968938|nr:D-lyxose/D-mannose family sugar isomerase [Clostridium sp. 'deep sea']QOR35392.1 D-lyxose/D-mannose family sugar isomerase [Clostridium sp. 'deep sea']
MKRSLINSELKWAKGLLKSNNISLPAFAYWSLSEWQNNNSKLNTIKELMLGWDITDYGRDSFNELGAVLFTLRNGSLTNQKIGTPYAEKLILLKDGQRLPLHYHASKTEDIINRAGGVLAIKLYNSLKDGSVDYNNPVEVDLDGLKHIYQAGEEVHITNGHSITLRPFMYHLFGAKEGCGDLICGEVSSINDDNIDNYNAEEVSRFAQVIEDEAILHPLCNEYKRVLGE